jgi:DnaJ-class molecular chaperone
MLEIKRDVNQEEISEAFKRLAIKFNPHVNLTS